MPTEPFQSFDQSAMGAFVESPLHARGVYSETAASCIGLQHLGYGHYYMLYPPFNIAVTVGTVTPDGGRDALKGKWADEIGAVLFDSFWQPTGIEHTFVVNNLNQVAQYPFLADMPHHQDGGSPSLDLSEDVPAAGDGIWLHSEPAPLVMSGRWMEAPGPWVGSEGDGYWTFSPAAPSMDMPRDIATVQQLFVNLKASLDFTDDPPAGDIRLSLRMNVVVTVGRMSDFYWAAPIKITYPGKSMDCLDATLVASGTGTDCVAYKPATGIPSLECHCICTAVDLSQCGIDLDMGINTLELGANYYACGDGEADHKFVEVAFWGGETQTITAEWAHGQTALDVTAARIRDAFSFSGSFSAWIAGKFASEFSGGLDIDNTGDTDRLETYIEASCVPATPGSTLPAALAGTQPLPAASELACFPQSGGNPVISKVILDNVDGWLYRLQRSFGYVIDADEATACAFNANLDTDLNLPYINTKAAAYMWICMLWDSYLSAAAAVSGILGGSELNNLPLRTDCFDNGLDTTTDEYVFGYDFPGVADLYGETYSYYAIDYAQSRYSFEDTPDLKLTPPRYNTTAWTQVASGGGCPSCFPYHDYYNCGLEDAHLHPECDNSPDDPEGSGLCDVLDADYIWTETGSYPQYYLLKKPQIEVRVKITDCYYGIRVAYRNWLVRETTCFYDDEAGTSYFDADFEDGDPWLTSMGFLEVSRGGQVYLPAGWSDGGSHFDSSTPPILEPAYHTRNIGTDRLLGGARAASPGYSTAVGECALRVYL